jgi:hypothetical protein
MKARNSDFKESVSFPNGALEALLLIEELIPNSDNVFDGCRQQQMLATLERYAIARVRSGGHPLDPGVWGRYLEYRASK